MPVVPPPSGVVMTQTLPNALQGRSWGWRGRAGVREDMKKAHIENGCLRVILRLRSVVRKRESASESPTLETQKYRLDCWASARV